LTKSSTTNKIDKQPTAEAGGSGFVPVAPFDIVVFGGTGDLARRKLLPSLFHRYCDGQIPKNSRIIGVSRSKHSRAAYQKLIEDAYHKFSKEDDFDAAKWAKFSDMIDYYSIDVMDKKADWANFSAVFKGAETKTRVFYLAMPPRMYAGICEGLKSAGCVSERARVVLEKPIGTDYESARAINEGVGKVFEENNIYRIDHYLGKETVQNLLVLRFANILLEPLWSHSAIEHVQITANWRWAGVPIYLRTGKRMKSRRSEVVIQFKSVPHSIFGEETKVNPNKLVIRLQPNEAVRLFMEIKEPGAGGLRLKTLPLNLTYADNFTVRYPDAYERLLMDVVRGNLSLFMRRDEVEAAWKWVDQIHAGWNDAQQRVELYPAGEDGPREAGDMLEKNGHMWNSAPILRGKA